MNYLFLIIGLTILVFSGNLLVKGGVQIANHLRIPKLVVGLTIVSIGTSAPELFVSLGAALNGSPDLSVGNVIGSNIANIGLILGITTLILPMPISPESSKINYPFMMGVSLLLWILALDLKLSLWDGFIFVVLLVGYITFLILRAKKKKNIHEIIEQASLPIWRAILYVLIATFGLYYGAELLVSSAQSIALSFGVSERVIGLTVLAFGTSVPELATSIIAAFKKQMDISVGNILGSNIFNILSVLGITSIVTPINVNDSILNFDIFFMIGISVLLFLTIIPLSKAYINRFEGFLLLSFYIVYVGLLFIQPI
ncbi:cation:H+ antiporter [Balneicella halophila]|uniref:Cation:H+ antiporter n=1 Tax=Balneicella halophila TaxID=1537566 RepID=A0A7L4UQ75_BALHA|nr:calcium/sodium antiporter [Balneicella halophila]PVX50742.1 cation:H+ antiporter [Balneicella halophila]